MNYSEFFTYFLKSSALLFVIWGLYKTVLVKETFFNHNRWYLLTGAAIAVLLPLWIIERTEIIEVALNTTGSAVRESFSAGTEPVAVIDMEKILFYLYAGGVIFFTLKLLVQFASLKRLITKGNRRKIKGIVLVFSREVHAPFSFFNYIVMPENRRVKDEEAAILAHEFIHARQYHSLDIVLMHFLTVFMWINPVAWLYRRDVAQNLEYLADREASTRRVSAKEYQYILLKQHLSTRQLSIINPFINSLIKKRIVMLHQRPSKQFNLWKLGLALPFLIGFVLLFNLRTVAQYHIVEPDGGPHNVFELQGSEQEHLDFMIHKDMTETQLEALKEEVARQGGKLRWKKLKRNAAGEITDIEVIFSHGDRNASASFSETDGIENINFGLRDKGGIYITTGQDLHTEEEMVWISKDGDHHFGKHINKEVIVIAEGDSAVSFNSSGQDMKFIVKSGSEDAVWVTESDSRDENKFIIIEETTDDSTTTQGKVMKKIRVEVRGDKDEIIHLKGDSVKHEKIIIKKIGAVQPNSEKSEVHVLSTDGKQPLMIVDGKETSRDALETTAPSDIAHIEVLKGEKAEKAYGAKGKNGVVKITTKKNKTAAVIPPAPPAIPDLNNINWAETTVIIDGRETEEKDAKELDPKNIELIEVLKGEKAREKYGKDNAILITTKE